MQNPYLDQKQDLNINSLHNTNPDSLVNTVDVYSIKRPVDVVENVVIDNKINTNISDYTIDDIFKLLDINIEEESDYNSVKNEIEEKINKHIGIFKNLKNEKLVEFFKGLKGSILGDSVKENMTEAQQLLHIYEDVLNENKLIEDEFITNMDKSSGVNSTHRSVITKILSVDSLLRTNQEDLSTEYTCDLTYNITNVTEMKLNDIEFEPTYYIINHAHETNYFWCKYNIGNILQFVYVYLPDGNYTAESLTSYINTQFDNNNVPLEINVDISYNSITSISHGTHRTTIGFKSTADLDTFYNLELNFQANRISETDISYSYQTMQIFSQDLTLSSNEHGNAINEYFYTTNTSNLNTLLGWILGYRVATYTGNISYISDAVFNINGPRYFYLIINDFNVHTNMNFLSSSSTGLLLDNVIAKIIPRKYPFNSQVRNDYTIYSEERKYHGPVDINKLEIRLIDEFDRTIDLNGTEISFSLSFQTLYATNQTVN